MQLDEFHYELPKELIAQSALTPKDSSRLMVLEEEKITHKHFYDILYYLKAGDTLVINEAKVSRAILKGKKETGGVVELMLTSVKDDLTYECHIDSNVKVVGKKLVFSDEVSCVVLDKKDNVYIVKFNKAPDNQMLKLPTPPYIKQELKDESQYQTIYSKKEGSLAAPTAGLHFTDELFEKIQKKGVKIARLCLHVGFGTFLPVMDSIENHKMHQECFEVDKKNADIINNRKGRLIVVGTTSVRTLEATANKDGKIVPQIGSTEIFIYPGYKFKNNIDALITNFHLPKSTLLMLVSAYYGRKNVLAAYIEAVKEKYRFFSLGDAMMMVKH
jgi:S-adenosylmethionine:tRNA ribosyltransferase-isomerase